MKFLHKLEKNLEESILGVLLVGMALILMAQILMRVFAKNSLSWAEEIARYFYVWSVFLSIGCTIRTVSYTHLPISFFGNRFWTCPAHR